MNFNYWILRKLFEIDQVKKRKEYIAAGMGEEAIKEMYIFDLYVFNNERKEMKHRAHYSEMLSYDPETGEFHYKDMDEFPATAILYSRLSEEDGWIEEIDDPDLYDKVNQLTEINQRIVFLLTLAFSQTEIAEILGVSQSAVWQRIQVIKNFLKKF